MFLCVLFAMRSNTFLDIVPPPLASASSTQGSILTNEQRTTANNVLASLNREAGNAARASARLEQTLADVQKLLNPDDLTR